MKEFNCEFCDQKFYRLHNLKSHIYIHTGERPCKCDVCELSFSRQQDLKRHQRSHDGIKPYQCQHCGRCFARQDALARHQKSPSRLCAGLSKPKDPPLEQFLQPFIPIITPEQHSLPVAANLQPLIPQSSHNIFHQTEFHANERIIKLESEKQALSLQVLELQQENNILKSYIMEKEWNDIIR